MPLGLREQKKRAEEPVRPEQITGGPSSLQVERWTTNH